MEQDLKAAWLAIGQRNHWISRASDPHFTSASFYECASDEELLDKFDHGNWSLGQAFHIGDLCFIQQDNGGDEWLTIKGGLAFESISFGSIIGSKGRGEAQSLLDRIRKATLEQCRKLEY